METQREKRNEYEGDFLNDVGLGIARVLYVITWLISAIFVSIPLLLLIPLLLT